MRQVFGSAAVTANNCPGGLSGGSILHRVSTERVYWRVARTASEGLLEAGHRIELTWVGEDGILLVIVGILV